MRLLTTLVVSAIVLVSACGDDSISGSESVAPSRSSWRFVSLEVDGNSVEVDQPLFLDITEDSFQASTTCNWISGRFAGQMESTAMACEGARGEIERYFTAAFQTEPTQVGGQLSFDNGDVRLVYEAVVDPLPKDLFAVLGDPNASVDKSMLPSEQATGTMPPEFDALVPVPSPSSDIDLFIAELGGDVCIVYGTATLMDKFCSPPRIAGASSPAIDIPINELPLARVALIPDSFGPAAAARPDLGTYESNILMVRADAHEGRHVLTDDQGNTLSLVIPPPWTDPMAASRTDPEA